MFTVIYGRLLNLALQAGILKYVRDFIESHGGVAAQIGYEGYKYATCCSIINDEICHGFPRKVLKDGDLIKVEMCVDLKGAISDSCWSYVVVNQHLKLIA